MPYGYLYPYANSKGISMSTKTALFTLTLSLLLGNGVASATDFNKGLDAARSGDYETALSELNHLAKQGDALAQYELGQRYAKGLGVLENDMTATQWFTLAANQGDVPAQYALGYMYQDGDGVLIDLERAHAWSSLASASGDENSIALTKHIAREMTSD